MYKILATGSKANAVIVKNIFKKIRKMPNNQKNYCTFAKFKPKNVFLGTFTFAVFLIDTNIACYAVEIKGYQPLVGLPHCKVRKCSLARIGEGSLPYLRNFNINFCSTMPKNDKNCLSREVVPISNTSIHETELKLWFYKRCNE